jgi:general secretion pathway protein N
VAPAVEPVAPPPQKAAEPERPPLTLIGAVVGDSDAIAVFMDRTSQKFVRLRQGDAHAGWVLSEVQRREVTLTKADRREVLALQRQEGPAGVAGIPPIPVAVPAAGSYAPFIPRSTPKNGESDGL